MVSNEYVLHVHMYRLNNYTFFSLGGFGHETVAFVHPFHMHTHKFIECGSLYFHVLHWCCHTHDTCSTQCLIAMIFKLTKQFTKLSIAYISPEIVLREFSVVALHVLDLNNRRVSLQFHKITVN